MGVVARRRLMIRGPIRQLIGLGVVRVALLLALLLPASGCVRRRLNVRTNPPGALVYVDNQQIGTTPCSVDFIYYGTREIRIDKAGLRNADREPADPNAVVAVPGFGFRQRELDRDEDSRQPHSDVQSRAASDRANAGVGRSCQPIATRGVA